MYLEEGNHHHEQHDGELSNSQRLDVAWLVVGRVKKGFAEMISTAVRRHCTDWYEI